MARMPRKDGNTHATRPPGPATHFGRQVRKERKALGWSIHQLASETGVSAGHLSRIENGYSPPTEHIALTMDRTFPHRNGWFAEYYHDSQLWTPPGYRHWAEHELRARVMRVWSPCVVDGLAQTPEYARAHLETVPGVPAEVVSARLAARMDRQRAVLHGETPPDVWLLVDEFALFRLMGSAEIMAAQMGHLLSVAALPNVTLQVVPGMGHAGTSSNIIVTDTAAYAEHSAGGYVYTEPETVASLGRILTTLQSESYRASESVELIERVKELWARGESPLTAALKAAPASKSETVNGVS